MLLFRPPVQKFGRPGVRPAQFAAGSTLEDDQTGLADRANAEFLWALLPPLPTGTTTVGDDGSHDRTGSDPGVQTQAYRGLVMPLSGDPIVYESSIVSGSAEIVVPFLPSGEQIWAPTVSVPASAANVVVPSFDTTEEFGEITVTSAAGASIQVPFLESGEIIWAPTIEGPNSGFYGYLVSMAQARAHLRSDDSDDDTDLAMKIMAASAAVVDYLGEYAEDFADADGKVLSGATVPSRVQMATLLTVGYLYRERDGSQDYAVPEQFGYGYSLPKGATALLYSLRKPVLA